MNRVLRFIKFILTDIIAVICVTVFLYTCLHIPAFITAYPIETLTILLVSMLLCLLSGFWLWIKTRWDKSKD